MALYPTLNLVERIKSALTKLVEPSVPATPVVGVTEGSDLYAMVKSKMNTMENESTVARLHTLEKLVAHLSYETMQQKEVLATCRELLVHLATTNEEILHIMSDGEDGYCDNDECEGECTCGQADEEELPAIKPPVSPDKKNRYN